MPAHDDVALAERRLAPAAIRICCCTMSMPVIELGDRMLDLHARVHLDEEELAVLVQELERAGAAVADAAAGVGAALADARERSVVDAGRGRLLDDLLVPALHRAVALEEIDGVLVLVGEHLDLDGAGW